MTTILRRLNYGLAAASALLFFHTPILLAQEAFTLEEVVVTARKREENLQQVPVAITAFTEKTIERAGIERPQDFIALTPNVTIVDTANVGDTQVTIRGQVSTRDAESTFAYVVDGVLMTNPNSFNEELFDVEQIEVLKGPQGALYGRNAVAGAILVNTKRPGNEVQGNIKVGAGTDDLQKISGMFSGPIVKDKMYGRIAGSYRESDGEYRNKLTGNNGDVDYFEDTSLRGRLIWDIKDNWTVDTQISYSDVEAGAINFNATFALEDAAAIVGVPELYLDVNDTNFQYTFNVPSENKQETMSVSFKSDYEMDWATFTAIVAYDDLDESLISDGTSAAFGGYANGAAESATACLNSYNDPALNELLNNNPPAYAIQDGNPPGTPIGPGQLNSLLAAYTPTTCDGYQYQERNQDSLSLEMKLTSAEDQELRWVGGIYYAEIDRQVAVGYGADLGLGFKKRPYVDPAGPNPTDQLFWDDFDTTVFAGFGQIETDITDRQELAFALRWDREEREVSNKVPNVLNSQIYGGGAPINPAYDGSLTDSIADRDENFSQWQPKISWTWEATDELNTYASWGLGFRSGGFNSIGSEATINNTFGSYATAPQNTKDDYDKEVTSTFEIGAKSDWLDDKLRVNAAVFYTEVDDYQFFNFYAGPFGLLRVVSNVDEVTIQGFEVDFQAIAGRYISFYGSYGYIDSEIEKNKNRRYTEGNNLPNAPEQTASLGTQFLIGVTETIDFVARLDWQYVGETWFHTVQEDTTTNFFTDLSAIYGPGFGFGEGNFDKTKRDSFDTLNLRLSLEEENWVLTAWGTNITDEDYLEEVIPAPEFGGSFNHPAKGEAYGVDFTYRF